MLTRFHPHHPLRLFFVSGLLTVTTFVLVFIFLGWEAALVALMLTAIELTFSFDNAIINARVLAKMSPFWQKMFMTVGILIAVFGMRIVFPILIVMFSSGLDWLSVINLALHNPDQYSAALHNAHPSIASFGGMFLLMLSLHFFFDSSRPIRWLEKIEKPLQSIGQSWLHILVCTLVLFALVILPVNYHPGETLVAGFVGILTYVIIHGASEFFTRRQEKQEKSAGKKIALAGFASFIYLEILDASFSFDGVIGAFAVTKDVILIAIGLGIGAIWVRSLTLFVVHRKVLNTYRYLEHGAHYVIGALALTLLVGLFYDIPEAVAGVFGIAVIALSIVSSVRYNKRS
jgi:hypothetical protein